MNLQDLKAEKQKLEKELTAMVFERVETFKALTGVQISSLYIEMSQFDPAGDEPRFYVTDAHATLCL